MQATSRSKATKVRLVSSKPALCVVEVLCMRPMGLRPDVFSGSAIAGVPVTLKTAWEARTGQNAPSVRSCKLKTVRACVLALARSRFVLNRRAFVVERFFVGCQHLQQPIFVSRDLD